MISKNTKCNANQTAGDKAAIGRSYSYLFFGFLAFIVIAAFSIILWPRTAHFTVRVRTTVFDVKHGDGWRGIAWTSVPVSIATPELSANCLNPTFRVTQSPGTTKQSDLDLKFILQTDGYLYVDVRNSTGGAAGEIHCESQPWRPSPSNVVIGWPSDEAAHLVFGFSGIPTIGEAVSDAEVSQDVIEGGSIWVHVQSPFGSGSILQQRELAPGDVVTLYSDRSRTEKVGAYGILQVDKGSLDVTLQAEAAEAAVLSFGQRSPSPLIVAPTIWSRLQVAPEWGVLALLFVILLGALKPIISYLNERGLQETIDALPQRLGDYLRAQPSVSTNTSTGARPHEPVDEEVIS